MRRKKGTPFRARINCTSKNVEIKSYIMLKVNFSIVDYKYVKPSLP